MYATGENHWAYKKERNEKLFSRYLELKALQEAGKRDINIAYELVKEFKTSPSNIYRIIKNMLKGAKHEQEE